MSPEFVIGLLAGGVVGIGFVALVVLARKRRFRGAFGTFEEFRDQVDVAAFRSIKEVGGDVAAVRSVRATYRDVSLKDATRLVNEL